MQTHPSFVEKLINLEYKAKHVRRLSTIMNTILANACYSDKEMRAQIFMAQSKGDLNEQELQLLKKSWEARKHLTQTIMEELKTLIDELMGAKDEGNKE